MAWCAYTSYLERKIKPCPFQSLDDALTDNWHINRWSAVTLYNGRKYDPVYPLFIHQWCTIASWVTLVTVSCLALRTDKQGFEWQCIRLVLNIWRSVFKRFSRSNQSDNKRGWTTCDDFTLNNKWPRLRQQDLVKCSIHAKILLNDC